MPIKQRAREWLHQNLLPFPVSHLDAFCSVSLDFTCTLQESWRALTRRLPAAFRSVNICDRTVVFPANVHLNTATQVVVCLLVFPSKHEKRGTLVKKDTRMHMCAWASCRSSLRFGLPGPHILLHACGAQDFQARASTHRTHQAYAGPSLHRTRRVLIPRHGEEGGTIDSLGTHEHHAFLRGPYSCSAMLLTATAQAVSKLDNCSAMPASGDRYVREPSVWRSIRFCPLPHVFVVFSGGCKSLRPASRSMQLPGCIDGLGGLGRQGRCSLHFLSAAHRERTTSAEMSQVMSRCVFGRWCCFLDARLARLRPCLTSPPVGTAILIEPKCP